MKIYIASSWRNVWQPQVVSELRHAGHEVYDFRNPREGNHGFHWSEIDPDYRLWSTRQYVTALGHPIAVDAYGQDFKAMEWADLFVGVQPFGRSASMEMGWAAGRGKPTVILLSDGEPELMVRMFDCLAVTSSEMLAFIASRAANHTPQTSDMPAGGGN